MRSDLDMLHFETLIPVEMSEWPYSLELMGEVKLQCSARGGKHRKGKTGRREKREESRGPQTQMLTPTSKSTVEEGETMKQAEK